MKENNKMNEETSSKEKIILLHGIRLNKWSLFLIQKRLEKSGYSTLAISYPSTRKSLDDIADWLRQNYLTEEFWHQNAKVHFVTHSMGGLVARRYLDKYKVDIPLETIGRVVMLGPPNQGSEIADLFHRFPPYRWIFGPAGTELSTYIQEKNPASLYYEAGVVAGSVSWLYPISGLIIPGPNDGRVAVERTKLDDLKDHITLSTSHTLMIHRKSVFRQVVAFLKTGKFDQK